jgi:hypothetical protein
MGAFEGGGARAHLDVWGQSSSPVPDAGVNAAPARKLHNRRMPGCFLRSAGYDPPFILPQVLRSGLYSHNRADVE